MPDPKIDAEWIARCRKYVEAATWTKLTERLPEPNVSVLVFIPNWDHYGPGIYRAIHVVSDIGERWHCTAWACGRDLRSDALPTHWMPLPDTPDVPNTFPLALRAIEEQRKRIAELESENSCMTRQLAEPPERLLRIAELESSVIATQRIMAEFKHIYPDGFPDGMEARPEHLESQVTSLCNTQRATFQNFVDLIAERDAKSERISDLERQLAEARK